MLGGVRGISSLGMGQSEETCCRLYHGLRYHLFVTHAVCLSLTGVLMISGLLMRLVHSPS